MKLLVTSLGRLLALGLALSAGQAQAQLTYTPAAVTGYTEDVIANGSGTVASSTTATVDRGIPTVRWCFADSTFISPAGLVARPALPNNGFFRSLATPNLTFQMGPSAGNNSLRIDGAGSGTLTLVTPRPATEVVVLATEGNGSSAGKTFVITFTDGTSQTVSGVAVPDWFGTGATAAIVVGSRVSRANDAVDNAGNNPKIWEVRVPINAANYAKPIQSVTVSKTSTDPVLNVMGISLGQPCVLPAGSLTASSTSICAGQSVQLALNSTTMGAFYASQWQSAVVGTGTPTWTNIAGATGPTYSATPQVTTQYRLRASCGAQSVLIGPVTVTVGSVTSSLTYTQTSFCRGASASAAPAITPAGGTFSAPAGLSLNATTGVVTPATSTPGTYTVTYTPQLCAPAVTATVTVFPAAPATVAYSAPSYCRQGSSPAPAVSIPGGTFTAPAGLSLNASTGVINLANSTAGTYAITYSTAGPCPATTTTAVAVVPLPTPALTYNGTEFCRLGANATPSATPAGGTFSSSAGLVIDPATGTIDVSKSAAGAYTVTYASGGQCNVTTTAAVRLVGSDAPTYPNVLTPNGDKMNDVLKPKLADVTNYKLQVFSRWGRMVYEGTDPTQGWSAAENSGGTYFYRVEFTDCTGRRQEQRNWIEVIK